MARVAEKELNIFENYTDVVLVDISWVMHRSIRAFSNLTVNLSGVEIPTGHFYGVLDSCKKALSAEGKKVAVILVRDGYPKERMDLMASIGGSYKEGRPELAYDFYKDVPRIIKLASKHPDVYYSYHSDKESDDVLYCIAKRMKKRLVKPDMWIYSGDNDLLQAISPRISVFRTFDKKSGGWIPITRDNVANDEVFTKKFHGAYPEELPLYRTIAGDSSDSLKGIERFPRDLLIQLIRSYENFDIEELIDFCSRVKHKKESYQKYINKVVEEQDRLRVLWRVIKLEDDFVPKIVKVIPSEDEYDVLCDRYQITSWRRYVSEVRQWQY